MVKKVAGSAGKTGGPSGGQRLAKVRVRTAHKRSTSSNRWLERQLNDPYVAATKRDGWRSRAAFKLIEIDDRHRLLKRGHKVIDLGAAPGGWSQVAAQRTGAVDGGGGKVVAVDYLAFDPIPGVTILQMDFMDQAAPTALINLLKGEKADVVLSDMAASTGHTKTDHLRIMALAEAAAAFAIDVLAPGGSFLCKVFQGGTEGDLLKTLKQHFRVVRHLKPPASRAESAELYVVATGFRGSC